MQLAQAGSIFVFGGCLSVYKENINRFYAVYASSQKNKSENVLSMLNLYMFVNQSENIL